MVSAPSTSRKSPCIMHLASCRSLTSPIDSSDEAFLKQLTHCAPSIVMAEVSGIHVLPQASREDVDGWAKPSHDECDGLVSLIERWYYGAAAVRARCSRPSDGPTSDPNRHG